MAAGWWWVRVWVWVVLPREAAEVRATRGPRAAELLQGTLSTVTVSRDAPSSSPSALALLVYSVSHVWPIWTFFVN